MIACIIISSFLHIGDIADFPLSEQKGTLISGFANNTNTLLNRIHAYQTPSVVPNTIQYHPSPWRKLSIHYKRVQLFSNLQCIFRRLSIRFIRVCIYLNTSCANSVTVLKFPTSFSNLIIKLTKFLAKLDSSISQSKHSLRSHAINCSKCPFELVSSSNCFANKDSVRHRFGASLIRIFSSIDVVIRRCDDE